MGSPALTDGVEVVLAMTMVAQLTWMTVGVAEVEAEPSLEVLTDAELATSGAAQVAAEVGLDRATVALAPGARSPRAQLSGGPVLQLPWEGVAVHDRPALVGRVSTTVTPWAVPVPELVTVIV